MIWRWDQGRLLYFEFDILKKISKVLTDLNGVNADLGIDLLRKPLEAETGMPFAPSTYTIWRNYKRVFECSFLATKVGNKIIATDFCLEVSKDNGLIKDIDDYFSLYLPRFRFPFPAFQEYNPMDKIAFPFCSIIKFLTSKKLQSFESRITIDEVFNIIIANECTGFESIDYYRKLQPKDYTIIGDQKRQVREMLIFISQMSILKWFNNSLFLDISIEDIDTPEFQKLITPILVSPNSLREQDFLQLTKLNDQVVIPAKLRSREEASDEVFIEGKKTRVTHLKIERSPLLRKIFLEQNPRPVCHMCEVNMTHRYPWTSYLIEMHHILPLSAGIAISTKGTSLDDLIGLCPSCHRSVHLFYKSWLDNKHKDDFIDKVEAKEVYLQAKERMAV